MSERRMFAKTIIDSDSFMDMPLSTQALYFHLSMRADDDGFINNPKKIQRMVGCGEDDLKLLIAKRFIIPFESGIVVIKHWKIHNYIRNDRYKPTVYVEEKSMLETKDNNGYTLKNDVGIPNGYQMETQVRLGKDSIGKDNNKYIGEIETPIINETIEDFTDSYEEEREKVPQKEKENNSEMVKEIVEYLNLKTGKNFRDNNKETIKHIKARINDNFTMEDFKKVIDIQCSKWLNNPNYEMYLRPQTLFGTKFESYLNSITTVKAVGEKPKEKKWYDI